MKVFWSINHVSVSLISSYQVVCEGRSAQPVSADSLLYTEASWDSSQCKQTGWPANSPPTASLLYRSPRSASLLGLLVPQHSTPCSNTRLVWKAQSKGIAWWVPKGVEWLLLHWWVMMRDSLDIVIWTLRSHINKEQCTDIVLCLYDFSLYDVTKMVPNLIKGSSKKKGYQKWKRANMNMTNIYSTTNQL